MNKALLPYTLWAILGPALMLTLASCSGAKKIGTASDKDSPDFILRKIETQQVRATWFEGKARLSFEDSNQSVKANATLRMRTDSAVWVTVRKLGFEVARVLITPDSVFVLDRLNNEYGAYDLSGLANLYQLPPDLRLLQNLILGNPTFLSAQRPLLKNTGSSLILEERNSLGELRYRLQNSNYRIQEIEFSDWQSSKQVQMILGDYADTPDKQKFSYLRHLTIDSQETGKIKVELKFSEVELNIPKSLSFEVPSRYSRMR